ncbi:hypothetical protein ACHWQZ_G018919 [Mnemiopsis leidyi]
MKRRDVAKRSLVVFIIIVIFNLTGFYYLSVADRAEKKENTFELIETFYKDKIATLESENDNSVDNLIGRDDSTIASDNDLSNQQPEDDLNDDDNFLQKIRKEHNLPMQENDIVIETFDDNVTPTKSDIQADGKTSSVAGQENEEPERLVRKTMIESNDWDNDNNDEVNDVEKNDVLVSDVSENNADGQFEAGENLRSVDHMLEDNKSDDHVLIGNKMGNFSLHTYQYSKVEEMTEDSGNITDVDVSIRYLSELVNQTGLELPELDKLYNLTRVENVDLHDLKFLDNFYRYNYKAIEKRIKDRMESIRNICQDPSLERNRLGFQRRYNLYQMNELGVSWCPVFKSGSTTWRNYFIDKFVADPPQEYYLDLLKSRQLTSGKRLRTNQNGKVLYKGENEGNVRFSVIRHPFSRLVSHVKSSGREIEMVHQQDIWIQNAMLEARSRAVQNHTLLQKYKTEFDNYFNWLKAGNAGSAFNRSSDNPFLSPPYPTLSEMVDHIMKRRRIRNDWDGHWMPGHEFCDICRNAYTYIIKLEEEPLELWYLVDVLGLWADREVFLNRANSSTRKQTEMLEVWSQIETLGESQREFIERHFDVDFRMFDYKRRKVEEVEGVEKVTGVEGVGEEEEEEEDGG